MEDTSETPAPAPASPASLASPVKTARTWSRRRALSLIGCLMVVGLGLDQLTKWWAETALGQGRVVSLIDDWLVLRLVRNPGAAFSLGESFTYVFTLLALIVLVAAWWWSARAVRRPVWAALIGVGLAGVTGNLIDRLCQPPGVGRGHVIDFISLRYFATFNVADICLTVAAAGLVIISFRGIGPR